MREWAKENPGYTFMLLVMVLCIIDAVIRGVQ